MKVHEYQAKEVLSSAGIPVPRGRFAATGPGAAEAAAEIGGRVVVKAQVHAGGRGKAGGIKIVDSPEDAGRAAAAMVGTRLVTPQTGPEGVPVAGVLVEEALDVSRELYLSALVDGTSGGVVFIASQAGGVEIEEIADKTPEKIARVAIDPSLGFQPYQGRKVAYSLGLDGDHLRPTTKIVADMHGLFAGKDCSLVEVNPLVVTADGRVLAADAKVSFDDDALFRHPELVGLHDPGQEEPLEVRAREAGVSYVKLDGDVGCMVNGAGLAMATMDVTKAVGAAPANFLDVGGGADEDQVAEALQILLSDSDVKRVLINIFGGILRCDVVANGLLKGSAAMPGAVRPMVVRMLGTNADEGREIMARSALKVTLVHTFAEAAEAIRALDRAGE